MKPFIKRSNSSKKTRKSRKTQKKRTVNLNSAPPFYYSRYYKNTHTIPKTQIIHYLLSNYKPYFQYKKKCDESNTIPLQLNECFLYDASYFPKGLRKNQLRFSLEMNSKTPLDKLIAYCFYIKQPTIFEKNHTLEDLKNQIGKDISRDDRTINDISRNKEYYHINDSTNYSIADLFYQNVIDEMKLYTNQIDLNVVNKCALLSCQNVYGLITDLITMQINDMLEPEHNTVFRPEKHATFIIQPSQLSVEYYFKTQMIITRDGEPFDPEYPCGNLEFTLNIDLLKNKYSITEFAFDYDIDKCGPEKEMSGPKPKTKKFKPEYMLPATAVSAGIVAMPFILPLL